jgi:hypothetical protein
MAGGFAVRRTQLVIWSRAPRQDGRGSHPLVVSPPPRNSVNFGSDTRLRRGFVLASGYAPRPLVALVRRRIRQNRSIPRSALRKNSPAASTASMANVRASTAEALVTNSSICRSSPFKDLPFAATILACHFPGSCSKTVISSPLYCIARPPCVFITGRKGEQKAYSYLEETTRIPVPRRALGRRKLGLRS